MSTFLIRALQLILALSFLVVIHELGHFIFAKKAGVYVYEFSIGMGPRIFKFNRKPKKKIIKGKEVEVIDETDYCIRLFPIGGFVQMAGEEIEADEVVETAIVSGADFGIKAATAGALKVGVEKEISDNIIENVQLYAQDTSTWGTTDGKEIYILKVYATNTAL